MKTVNYPFWVVEITLGQINLRQNKDRSFSTWVHCTHEIRHIASFRVNGTIWKE